MNEGLGFKVQKVWVYLYVVDDGDEAVPAFRGPDGYWYPLVAADEQRLALYRPMAESVARESGRQVKLVCFEQRVELETIEP